MGWCQAPLGAGSCPCAQLPAQPNPSSARRALTRLSPQFGESQQLRMVRILRSTLMVRVGGGWIALDEFLVKNDPCRGGHGRPRAQPAPRGSGLRAPGSHCLCCPSPVKGRTNLKINEKYLSPDAFGATAAKCAGNQSAPSSKVLSPSRSNSSLSLYSSASAPSSPLARKVRAGEPRAPVLAVLSPPTLLQPLRLFLPQSVLRRTRSGDRCPRSRGSLLPDGAELQFTAAEESPDVAPPGEGCAAVGWGALELLWAGQAWGSRGVKRGEQEPSGRWGSGWGLSPSPRSEAAAPALPLPFRAARGVPPRALQPLPLSPPSHPPCAQHPWPAPLRTLLPGGRPPRG